LAAIFNGIYQFLLKLANMKIVVKYIRYIYSIYALITFIIVMLMVMPFVFLSLPFGRVRGGNFIYNLCRIWATVWYFFLGVRHQEIHEIEHEKSQQYIFIANHNSYMDIPPIVRIAHNPLRILGKYESSKIPIFGWIYREAVILVDRSNPERRAQSVRALKQAIADGLSIFIFPEGTFNESENPLKSFFDGAFRIAIETQTPIKPLLFIDTMERMHFSTVFSITPGKSRVVYLADIPVAGLTMEDLPALKERAFQQMEEGLKRYRKYPTVLSVF
jgi:1-acyl-sn-glycerol-3-phosphate acyltransferase